jgi:hypothetical protein
VPRTLINGADGILAASVTRSLLNTQTSGSAVIAKLIGGSNVSVSQTGADAGTGDVTISVTALPASILTGTALPASIVSSSLTSVGALNSLTVTNNATVSGNLGAGIAASGVVSVYGGGLNSGAGGAWGFLCSNASLTLAPNSAGTATAAQFGATVDTTAGTITAAYGLNIPALAIAGPNTITTAYGLYVAAQSIGASNFNVIGGLTRFGGATAPARTVDITGTLGVSGTTLLSGAATLTAAPILTALNGLVHGNGASAATAVDSIPRALPSPASIPSLPCPSLPLACSRCW